MSDTHCRKALILKRGDLFQVGNTQYIAAQLDDGLYAWDFKAWAEGYYDAYWNIGEQRENGYGFLATDEAVVMGNIIDDPELLPLCCDGYNGEPHPQIIERIYPKERSGPGR